MIFDLADMKYDRDLTAKSRLIQRECGEIICRLNNRGVLLSSITVRELYLMLDNHLREVIAKRIQYDIEEAKVNMAATSKEIMILRLDQALNLAYECIVSPIISHKAIEGLNFNCFSKMVDDIKSDAHRDLIIAIAEIESNQ